MVQNMDDRLSPTPQEKNACDPRVTRKEFLTTLVKRATIAGALLAAPKVVDKFLVPPAYARTSTTHIRDTQVTADTSFFRDPRTTPFHDRRRGPGFPHSNGAQDDDFG